MCFFTLIYKVFDDYPLVVASNRDEFLDRPGSAPAVVRPGILAGFDGRAGGTWLGVNRHGMIAAVTNRYNLQAPLSPTARSRGLLCLDLLGISSAASAGTFLQEQLALHKYNEFNFVVADRHSACAISLVAGELVFREFAPGVHVIANTMPDAADDPKVSRGLQLIEESGIMRPNGDPGFRIPDVLGELGQVCRDHGTPQLPDDSICIHAPDRGTLSSALIALHRENADDNRYLYAHGHPCEHPYQDMSELLRGLR